MSLLQGVLRSTADSLAIEKQLKNLEISRTPSNNPNLDKDESDDDLVNVVG